MKQLMSGTSRFRDRLPLTTGGQYPNIHQLFPSQYGSIQRMMDAKLIEETDERPVPELDDQRRRYYQLTDFGKRVLQAEMRRLANVITLAKAKLIPDGST